MVNCPVDCQICKLVLVSLTKNSPSVRRGYLLNAIPAVALGLRLCCREDLATNNSCFESGNDVLCGLHFKVCKDGVVYSLTLSLGSVRGISSLRYWERSKRSQRYKHRESPSLTSEEEFISKDLFPSFRGETSPTGIEVALIIEDNQLKLVVRYEPNDRFLVNILGTSFENTFNSFNCCSNFCHNSCGPAP